MSLTSTAALRKTIRDRLLFFTPAVGNDLNTRLGGRLYWLNPPDFPTEGQPYAIMRLINLQRDWEHLNVKVGGTLEILWFMNPPGELDQIDAAADVAEQALLYYRESFPDGSSIHASEMTARDLLPTPPETSDREVAQIRHLFELQWWPQYLTQYSYGG